MQRTKIRHLLATTAPVPVALVKGWVRTKRDAKDFSFVEVNDGSCLTNLQVIAVQTLNNYTEIRTLTTGSAIVVQGALAPGPIGTTHVQPPP